MANGIGVQGARAWGAPWLASDYYTPSGMWSGYTPLTSGAVSEAAGMGPPPAGAPGGPGGSGGQRLVLAPNMDFPASAMSGFRRTFSPPADMVPMLPHAVSAEELAGDPPWVGPAAAGLDVANIALSDRPDAAKGMMAAQALLPALSLLSPGLGVSSPFMPVQMLDLLSRAFGGGGLFSGNRPHAYVPPYEALSPAARAQIDEASTLNTWQPVSETSGLSIPQLRSLASANTALSPAEVAQVVQAMPFQDTLNPATMAQRVAEAGPGAPPPTWEQLSGWHAEPVMQQGGMVPWVPGRPGSGDVVKSWLEPGEVVVPRELAPTVLRQFPHLAATPRRQFFQGGGMVPWRGGPESPVWAPGGGLRFRDGGRVPNRVATLAAEVLQAHGIRPTVGAGALTMNARAF